MQLLRPQISDLEHVEKAQSTPPIPPMLHATPLAFTKGVLTTLRGSMVPALITFFQQRYNPKQTFQASIGKDGTRRGGQSSSEDGDV